MSRRLGLPFDEWPADWQARWQAAIAPASDAFDDDGSGAHWAPDTQREIRKRLEQFFGFLHRTNRLDGFRAPGDYVTEPYLRPYIKELENRVASVTLAGYVRDLMIGIRVIDPAANTAVIHMVARRLGRESRASRDKRKQHVDPDVLYLAGLARMERAETADYEKEDVRALQYGDGLAMAIVACSVDRRRNLVGMRIGENLRKIGPFYRLTFAGSETKSGHPHACDLPETLTPYIDHYIERHHAKLLGRNNHPELFISAYRKPMARQTLYVRFVAATKQELGIAVPPHRVRDSAVTGIAEKHPEMIGIASSLLHHRQTRTTQAHYNQADQISASRRFNKLLVQRRKEALKANRRGKLFPNRENAE